MNWQRLKFDDDIIFNKIEPIQLFFNAIADRSFIKTIASLIKGLGVSNEGITSCLFPADLDEYDLTTGEGFDGVEFSFYEKKLSVDVPTFRKYLRMACEAYWTEYPESRQILEKYLSRPQPPLGEGTLPLWKEMRDAGKFPKPYSEFN